MSICQTYLMEHLMENDIKSPCYGVCTLDKNRICIGCKRLQEEILEWPLASDDRKKQILENCKSRAKSS